MDKQKKERQNLNYEKINQDVSEESQNLEKSYQIRTNGNPIMNNNIVKLKIFSFVIYEDIYRTMMH